MSFSKSFKLSLGCRGHSDPVTPMLCYPRKHRCLSVKSSSICDHLPKTLSLSLVLVIWHHYFSIREPEKLKDERLSSIPVGLYFGLWGSLGRTADPAWTVGWVPPHGKRKNPWLPVRLWDIEGPMYNLLMWSLVKLKYLNKIFLFQRRIKYENFVMSPVTLTQEHVNTHASTYTHTHSLTGFRYTV